MKRRSFFGTSAGTIAALSGAAGCERKTGEASKGALSVTENGKLAGFTLEELREEYRYDLFDDYISFIYKHVVDYEYGGFMCNTDRDGTRITTNKRTRFEGRGIWVHSFLYNNIDPDPKHLEVARKSVEFILNNKPVGDNLWHSMFTREGKPLDEDDKRIGDDIFIANGFQEYAKAVGDETYWNLAKEILLKCVRIYDSPDYLPNYGSHERRRINAPRIHGHWMVLLRIATQMLEQKDDADIQNVADRALDAMMNRHFNPNFRLQLEVLNHDFSIPDNEYSQYCSIGHAIEAFWMIMFEAERLKDKALYDLAVERFKHHVEVAWDDVYGGCFHILEHIDNNIWELGKSLWLQEEILIGTLFMIEHTGDQWAKDWFTRIYTYVKDKFPLKQYGFPLWILYADRKVTFERHTQRVGNFHHPRHLMINMLAIDRMIKRGGNVSNLFLPL